MAPIIPRGPRPLDTARRPPKDPEALIAERPALLRIVDADLPGRETGAGSH